MGVVQSSSSQRNIRNMARKCKTEGCERMVAKDGARGLCGMCYYRKITVVEKKQGKKPKKVISEIDRHCAVRDPEMVLPVRQKFEWIGSLQESVARMNKPEEQGNGN